MKDRPHVPPSERLIVALDVPDAEAAKRLVRRVGEHASFYKIGLELFMSGGAFELLEWLNERGKQVFVDLKFFDIPATVARAVARLNGRGVRFLTVHGNDAMMQAAAEAARDVQVLAVTALTSLDRGDLDDLGFDCEVEKLVLSRATRALARGCAGVVASGREARALREALGGKILIVSPGIRPLDNREDDQKRMVTVSEALASGADYVVVGRPVRDAEDPARAAAVLQDRIRSALRQP